MIFIKDFFAIEMAFLFEINFRNAKYMPIEIWRDEKNAILATKLVYSDGLSVFGFRFYVDDHAFLATILTRNGDDRSE
jgi:hypothetical protein